MSVEHRRFVLDPDLDPQLYRLATIVNRLVQMINGAAGGRVWLLGDAGVRKQILGGATIDTGNFPLRVRSAAGNHARFEHSSGSPIIAAFTDAGVAVAALSVTGNATIGGTLGVTGATTLTGALAANGNVTLGDAASDVISVLGTPTFAENVTMAKSLAVDTTTLVVDGVANKVGVGVAVPTATMTVAGQLQVTNAITPSGGAGVEVAYNPATNRGDILAYDRTAAAFKDLAFQGLSVLLTASGVTRLAVNATGIGAFGAPPVAQPAAAAAATDLATVITLANNLRTGLRNLGWFS